MSTVWVPCDAAALSVGADEVADRLSASGATVRRNGSRGMLWLEPLVEVETARGRVGYSAVTAADVPALLAGALDDSAQCLGVVRARRRCGERRPCSAPSRVPAGPRAQLPRQKTSPTSTCGEPDQRSDATAYVCSAPRAWQASPRQRATRWSTEGLRRKSW